jgi:hypothetical protein
MSPDNRAGMYSVASIKACEFRTIDCFDVPLNQRICRCGPLYSAAIWCEVRNVSGNPTDSVCTSSLRVKPLSIAPITSASLVDNGAAHTVAINALTFLDVVHAHRLLAPVVRASDWLRRKLWRKV